MHKGSCLCGAVSFEVAGPLHPPDACHCSQCRKQSGHFWASTDVPRTAVTIHGADNVTWFRSSEKVRRGFCSTCGSSLFWDPIHKDTIDDEAEREEAREPRRARAVKPADVRALRRRTREEIEDGRVPRRARAVEPERATARRPRRPGREERETFPAVVDARRPGRGWEDEPEQMEPGLRRPGRGWR